MSSIITQSIVPDDEPGYHEAKMLHGDLLQIEHTLSLVEQSKERLSEFSQYILREVVKILEIKKQQQTLFPSKEDDDGFSNETIENFNIEEQLMLLPEFIELQEQTKKDIEELRNQLAARISKIAETDSVPFQEDLTSPEYGIVKKLISNLSMNASLDIPYEGP